MSVDVISEKTGVNHAEDIALAGHVANQEEHEQTAMQAIKAHPWAFFWCIFAIWVLVSTSFENQAGSSILGIPQFREDFGSEFEGQYVLDANWQSAFSGAPVASAVIGGLVAGSIADAIGRRGAYGTATIFSIVGIILELIATTNPVFFVGKLVNGLAIGAFIAISFTYIGEIAPVPLRGILSSAAAIAFTLGPLLVALIVNSTGTATTRWAYRAIFVAQFGVLAIAMAGMPFMPESPWWLLSKGKEEKAAKALKKLGYSPEEVEKRMAAISLTLEEVRRETEGATYLECFRKSNLRRTLISIAPLSIQSLSGIYFIAGYSTYYYEIAGYSTADSFKLQIVQQVISLLGNICSWFLIDRVGRRSLIFYGLILLTVVLFLTGALAVVGTPEALKGSCALILFYCFAYNVSLGAVAYTVLTETSTSRLRIKTIAIGTSAQNSLSTMWAFVLPYLFNPNEANLGAKIAFIFGGLAILCLVYLWFYQPETAGRTYEELDELFINRVPARKFKGTVTEAELKGLQAQEITQGA